VDSVSIEPTGLTLNLAGLGSHPLSAVRRIG
jgi:flagellar basal-body rod modification protein FlgD